MSVLCVCVCVCVVCVSCVCVRVLCVCGAYGERPVTEATLCTCPC